MTQREVACFSRESLSKLYKCLICCYGRPFSTVIDCEQVKEPSLEEVWRDQSNGLTASISSHLISIFAIGHEADDTSEGDMADISYNAFLASCQSILDVLRSVDTAGCDAGIAHAVAFLKKGNKRKKKHAARRVELLLGKQSPAPKNVISEVSGEPTDSSGLNASPVDDEFVRLLPARVALEHPDASVRLTAVKRLVNECEAAASTEANEDDGETNSSLNNDAAVDICQSLLRRFVADDDSGVAASAADALRRLIAEEIVSEMNVFADDDKIQDAISGLLKWSVLDDIPSKCTDVSSFKEDDEDQELSEGNGPADRLDASPPADPIEAMCGGLALAGLAASSLLRTIDDEDVFSPQIDHEGELLRTLLIYIGAHLDIASSGLGEEICRAACELICNAAASALIHAVAWDQETDCDVNIQDKATQLLCGDDNCLAVLLRTCCGDTSKKAGEIDKNVERRYMWACLNSMVDGLDGCNGSDRSKEDDNDDDSRNRMLAQNVLSVIRCILETFGGAPSQHVSLCEASVLIGRLVSCLASIISDDPTMIPPALIDLCSVPSSIAYDMVSKPAVLLLFGATDDTAETKLSSVAILMEAASRHGDEMATSRLIALANACLSDKNIASSPENVGNGFVQALALLSHSSPTVREQTIHFISTLSSSKSKKLPKLCADASKAIASHKSSIMMDGSGGLPNLLAEIVSKSNASDDAREGLLHHCVVAAIGTASSVEEGFSYGDYLGGVSAACTILDAMREAGENVFPLIEQWNKVGRPIFDAFLSPDVDDTFSDRYADVDMHAIKELCETVIVMLKGVATYKDYEPSVVISTGPAKSGRRTRSYSVGVDDDRLTFIEPYPYNSKFWCLNQWPPSDFLFRLIGTCDSSRNCLFVFPFLLMSLAHSSIPQ